VNLGAAKGLGVYVPLVAYIVLILLQSR
jgi:hypothetical protein